MFVVTLLWCVIIRCSPIIERRRRSSSPRYRAPWFFIPSSSRDLDFENREKKLPPPIVAGLPPQP